MASNSTHGLADAVVELTTLMEQLEGDESLSDVVRNIRIVAWAQGHPLGVQAMLQLDCWPELPEYDSAEEFREKIHEYTPQNAASLAMLAAAHVGHPEDEGRIYNYLERAFAERNASAIPWAHIPFVRNAIGRETPYLRRFLFTPDGTNAWKAYTSDSKLPITLLENSGCVQDVVDWRGNPVPVAEVTRVLSGEGAASFVQMERVRGRPPDPLEVRSWPEKDRVQLFQKCVDMGMALGYKLKEARGEEVDDDTVVTRPAERSHITLNDLGPMAGAVERFFSLLELRGVYTKNPDLIRIENEIIRTIQNYDDQARDFPDDFSLVFTDCGPRNVLQDFAAPDAEEQHKRVDVESRTKVWCTDDQWRPFVSDNYGFQLKKHKELLRSFNIYPLAIAAYHAQPDDELVDIANAWEYLQSDTVDSGHRNRLDALFTKRDYGVTTEQMWYHGVAQLAKISFELGFYDLNDLRILKDKMSGVREDHGTICGAVDELSAQSLRRELEMPVDTFQEQDVVRREYAVYKILYDEFVQELKMYARLCKEALSILDCPSANKLDPYFSSSLLDQ